MEIIFGALTLLALVTRGLLAHGKIHGARGPCSLPYHQSNSTHSLVMVLLVTFFGGRYCKRVTYSCTVYSSTFAFSGVVFTDMADVVA